MDPQELRLLLIKYRNGNCTDQERAIVEAWYDSLDKDQLPELNEGEKQVLEEKIWLGIIRERKQPLVSRPEPLRSPGYNWQRIAASVIIITGIGLAFFNYLPRTQTQNRALSRIEATEKAGAITHKNTGTTIKEITLADGSVVLLHPSSELTYEKSFNQTTRDVTLVGEAFFKVARNPEKTFSVRTHDLTTQVLGTSFNVKAYPSEKNSTVSVKTGRVTVSRHYETNTEAVVLTPNQQVVFVASEGSFRKKLVEKPMALVDQRMSFEERPVREVFAALEETFGVKINYNQEGIDNCNVTIAFTNENLFERMDLLCKILGASYQDRGAALFIEGRGCGGEK
jgi:ferric-dicitrate binding protein FerR (iron transport regulator)